MLQLNNIKKEFDKNNVVLDKINVTFKEGSINCIVGRNGAGKTTLLNLMSSILMPTSGEISYLGNNINQFTQNRKNIFYVAVTPFFYEKLNAKQNLKLIFALYEKSISEEDINLVIEKVGLESKDLQKPVFNYSSGMKQKLSFAAMLLVSSPVILLDEPFNALDTKTQMNFLGILKDLADENHTIIFTSHLINTMFKLAEYMYVLNEGKITEYHSTTLFDDEEQLEEWINQTIYT